MLAWLLAAKLTMRRIEPELKKQGFSCGSWDGPGFRVLSYATIILFQPKLLNDSNYPFVPVDATRKLPTKEDWYICVIGGEFGITTRTGGANSSAFVYRSPIECYTDRVKCIGMKVK